MTNRPTQDSIGLAFRKAMLKTDPEFDESNRAGAAFLAVLDELNVHCEHTSALASCDRWLEWSNE